MTLVPRRLAVLLFVCVWIGIHVAPQSLASSKQHTRYQQNVHKDRILCNLGNKKYCDSGKIGRADKLKLKKYCQANPRACRR